MPLEPTAVRCVRFLRSKTVGFCSSVIGINFCSAPLCFVGLGLAGAFGLLEPSWPRCALDRAEPNENEPTWKRQAYPETLRMDGAMDACCTPSPLGLAGALELAARARSASLGRSTGQSRTKTNRTRQAKLTRRRFAGQYHGCVLHSTQRRTYPCMECTGTH